MKNPLIKNVLMTQAFCLLIFSMSIAQEKSDNDLVKDGNPVSGMSAQQEKLSTPSAEISTSDFSNEDKRVPLLNESTLEDKEFESWRAGDMFRDEEYTPGTTRLDSADHALQQRQIKPMVRP